MKISIELTLTPLGTDFEKIIKDFIKKLRKSDLKVIETPLSTQVYGDYDDVMNFLSKNTYESFQKSDNIIMNMKIFKSDRSHYVPTF